MRCRASLATGGRSCVTANRYSSTEANAGTATHASRKDARSDRTVGWASAQLCRVGLKPDLQRRRRGRRLFLDDDRALQHQRGDRADGCELRREQRADHADRQRDVDEHAAVVVLDDDAADVALANDLLDLRQQRVAAELELFGTGSGLGHGRLLVFWLKAAKALSTSPSKGVAFAGYPINSFNLAWPVLDIGNLVPSLRIASQLSFPYRSIRASRSTLRMNER